MTVGTKTVTVSEQTSGTATGTSGANATSGVGGLGDTETITSGSVNLKATVAHLEDPAQADTSPSDINEPGKQWVRVTATLTNDGPQPFDTSNAYWELLDSRGQRSIGNDYTPIGPDPQLSGKLLSGDEQTGAVMFLVPSGAKPEEVRLTAPSGSSGTPARWSLR